jgi:tetratricopeptide (TPR) repeat protein
MSSPDDRIAQFRKMATDDPENDLAHYRLGQELLRAERYEEAIPSFQRTLELNPPFSKVYVLLTQCLAALGRRDEALKTAEQGYQVATQRGDNVPREEIAKLIGELGGKVPETPAPQAAVRPTPTPGVGGFVCQRPTCRYGGQAQQLRRPPTSDEVGQRIFETVCAGCWNDWLRNYSVKVINELRLDLSTERGQAEYDRYMREFLGLDEPQTQTLPQV